MFGLLRKKYVVLEGVEEDLGAIAELHRQSFPRGWSKSEISKLTQQDNVTVLVARAVGDPKGSVSAFNIIRQTADEAEILSIAVNPKLRRSGLGDMLMRDARLRLQADRVASLVLEVDESNFAAVQLYAKLGFTTVGNRAGYYANKDESDTMERAMALVMRLDLV